jgi:hypothetical protein
MKLRVGVIALAICASSSLAGINWKAVWMDNPTAPVLLEPGASCTYRIMGLNGADVKADHTGSPWLKLKSLDPNVVEVDQGNNRLIGQSPGTTEVEISFSEAKSLVTVFVRPKHQP